jgi:DNA-binding NtrC family response regulator
VLVVDDEDIVRQVVRATLEAVDCFALTANDGEQALKLSRSFRGVIHILVSDIVMPKMNGLALREQILRDRPAIKVLLMSGQTDQRIQDVPFLRKPFTLEDLKERVRALLEAPQTGSEHESLPVDCDKLETDILEQVRAAREKHARAVRIIGRR